MPTKMYTKPQQNTTSTVDFNRLPTDRRVAAYYRQSTKKQVGNVSTAMQQEDLPAWLMRQGWPKELIEPINDDEGISGATGADDREGLAKILARVGSGQIGAVACVNVDRLFRDQYLLHAPHFVAACAAAKVIVITPDDMPYVFHDPISGEYHIERFYNNCKSAGRFVTEYVSKRLHGAIRRNREQGLWSGFAMTPGYMVRIVHKNSGKLEPFEPTANVILEYFKLFVLTYRGNCDATAKHIYKHGPDLPDWESKAVQAQVPGGCKLLKAPNFKPRNGRYVPGVNALRTMFTNATYIGHWVVKGQIIIRNNHPAIVPIDLFMAAFNYLSPVTLEGEPNEHYRKHVTRPRKDEIDIQARGVKPLLDGLLYHTDSNGETRRVIATWKVCQHTGRGYYEYAANTMGEIGRNVHVWRKDAAAIDNPVFSLLSVRLALTLKESESADLLKRLQKDFSTERRRIEREISTLSRRMEGTIRGLSMITEPDPAFAEGVHAEYKALAGEKLRKEQKLAELDAQAAQQANARELLETLKQALALQVAGAGFKLDRNAYPDETWRNITTLCIKRVETKLVNDTDMEVTVWWNDDTGESIILPRRSGGWTSQEGAYLLELVDDGAGQEAIAEEFPGKNWRSIRERYRLLTGKGLLIGVPKPIADNETIHDYRRRLSAETGEPETGYDLTAHEIVVTGQRLASHNGLGSDASLRKLHDQHGKAGA